MPKVFSVFCYGTGEKHGKATTIIRSFADACSAPEKDKLIIDGPDALGFKVQGKVKKITNKIIAWLGEVEPDNYGNYRINMMGHSRGAVICTRVANAFDKMKKDPTGKFLLDSNGKKICDKNGEPIEADKVKFNIYENDPVAGLTDKGKVAGKTIPSNVENFTAIIQLDERRQDFKPQDLSRVKIEDPKKTNVQFLPLFGNHTDAAKINNTEMSDCATINWNLAHAFLTNNGTTFEKNGQAAPKKENNQDVPKEDTLPGIYSGSSKERTQLKNPSLNDKTLLESYANAKSHRLDYKNHGKKINFFDGSPFSPRKKRKIDPNDYVIEAASFDKSGKLVGGFFVNQHERELFKKTYPRTFNYLFEKGREDAREDVTKPRNTGFEEGHYKEEDVIKELAGMQITNNDLFKSLKVRGVPYSDTQQIPPKPTGISRIERCQLLTSLGPKSVSPHKQDPLDLPEKLDLLEKQVNQAVSTYTRQKGYFSTYSKRGEYDRAIRIKNEVRGILNGDATDEDKHKAALNCLEKNYKELKSSDSPSELTKSLEDILGDGVKGRKYKNEKSRPTLSTLIGKGMRGLGNIIKKASRVIFFFPNVAASFLELMAKRMNHFLYSRTKSKFVSTVFSLSFISRPLAWLIKSFSDSFQALGNAIKNRGENIIRSSKAYSVTRTDDMPAPLSSKAMNSSSGITPASITSVSPRKSHIMTPPSQHQVTHAALPHDAGLKASNQPVDLLSQTSQKNIESIKTLKIGENNGNVCKVNVFKDEKRENSAGEFTIEKDKVTSTSANTAMYQTMAETMEKGLSDKLIPLNIWAPDMNSLIELSKACKELNVVSMRIGSETGELVSELPSNNLNNPQAEKNSPSQIAR